MESSAGITLLVRTLLALAGVCGLAYLVLRYFLPRLQIKKAQSDLINVIEKVQVETNQTLSIIEVCGKFYLIASTPNSGSLLTEVDARKVEESLKNREVQSNQTGQKVFNKFNNLFKKGE